MKRLKLLTVSVVLCLVLCGVGGVAVADTNDVLAMKSAATSVATLQNEYKTSSSAEKLKEWFAQDAQNTGSNSWYSQTGTWEYVGVRMTDEDLYQVLWLCRDANNIYAYAKALYIPSQNKFSRLICTDTAYGAARRNATSSFSGSAADTVRELMAQLPKSENAEQSQESANREGSVDVSESQEWRDFYLSHR